MNPADIIAAAQIISGLMQKALEGQLSQQALEQLRAISEREFQAGLAAWQDSAGPAAEPEGA